MKRLAVSALAILLAASGGYASAETVKITVLGVGDIDNFAGGKARGGPARLNAVIKAERAANPNTIYLFTGDMLSPSLLSGFDKGSNVIELTNLAPFNLATPGNHEFDFGPENFAARLKESQYPWGAVNITGPDGQPALGLTGVTTAMLGGVKLAIVPAVTDETPAISSPGDLVFAATAESAIEAAKAARAAGADIVIGSVHAPHKDDQALIASKAFDVLVSGHDHDLVVQYNGVTAYVETSNQANHLVPIDLNVTVEEKDGKRSVKWEPGFRFIDTAAVTPDPETQARVDAFSTELDKELNVEIGKTAGPLDSRRAIVRSQEAAIGNLIADAMREATGADIAITNGGGIRADKEYAAGSALTRRDVLSELPFGNTTVLVEVTGLQILEALENGFSQIEDGGGRFPQVSGLTIEVDKSKGPGQRVLSVLMAGKPLDPVATYKLATNDFMLNGGDGYVAFRKGKVLVDGAAGKLMANDVMVKIRAAGTVDAKVEGRIVFRY
ncbi:MAG: bifunctional metallophosphatase/5'-nucleotidase [Proteobacteria bacterium]|nr:bifunctional metallophosphatase/5'-nucleotidase [Pseudomonadota bacterium]